MAGRCGTEVGTSAIGDHAAGGCGIAVGCRYGRRSLLARLFYSKYVGSGRRGNLSSVGFKVGAFTRAPRSTRRGSKGSRVGPQQPLQDLQTNKGSQISRQSQQY